MSTPTENDNREIERGDDVIRWLDLARIWSKPADIKRERVAEELRTAALALQSARTIAQDYKLLYRSSCKHRERLANSFSTLDADHTALKLEHDRMLRELNSTRREIDNFTGALRELIG